MNTIMSNEPKNNELELFITNIRETDTLIEKIYTNGGCYGFAKLMHELYPESELYIRLKENQYHVIIKYQKKFYDINGEVKETSEFSLLTENIIENLDMENWDSSKNLNVTPKYLYGALLSKDAVNKANKDRLSKIAICKWIGIIIFNLLFLFMLVVTTTNILAVPLDFFYGISRIETYNITACIFIVSFSITISWKILNNIVSKFNMIVDSLQRDSL